MEHQHQLKRMGGKWQCERCAKEWESKPRSSCAGMRVWNSWDIDWERLATVTGLRRRGLRLAPGQHPAGCYERSAGRPRRVLLYWIKEAVPARPLSAAQRQALERAREGWRRWRTCAQCGGVIEPERRRQRRRSCWACEEEERLQQRRREGRAWLQDELRRKLVVLDTETTGLPEDPGFQVVEVAVVSGEGELLFRSLVRPDAPITPGAQAVHGLREEDLKGAPTFPEIWGPLSRLLEACDSIWAYHAAFDRLALEASARRWRLELPGWLTAREKWHCLMELYAEWMGLEYWVPLERACRQEGIAAGWHPHTAELDAQAALALLRVLAGLEKA